MSHNAIAAPGGLLPMKEHGTSDRHLGLLTTYLRNDYRLVKTFADLDQVWQRP